MEPFGLPQPPKIDEATWQKCRETGDFCPVLFEWYKFVGALCNFFATIRGDSDDIKEVPALHYAVLVALLNRCSRLMLANIALSHKGLFGETTAILDRCIFESVVKIMWLCANGDAASFERLILDGLKSEVEFKKLILDNVKTRGGSKLIIEERMLSSIDNYLATVPTTEAAVDASPKLPDMASMITLIGHGRMVYVVGQRMGSHHVHGTWPSLWRDYLEEHDGALGPRDHDCPTHENQYVFVMLMVLDAMRSFIDFAAKPGEGRTAFTGLLDSVQDEINNLNAELVGGDFEHVQQI